MNEINILGIVSRQRKGSYNRMELKAAREPMPEGTQLELREPCDIPIFDQGRTADLATRQHIRKLLEAPIQLVRVNQADRNQAG